MGNSNLEASGGGGGGGAFSIALGSWSNAHSVMGSMGPQKAKIEEEMKNSEAIVEEKPGARCHNTRNGSHVYTRSLNNEKRKYRSRTWPPLPRGGGKHRAPSGRSEPDRSSMSRGGGGNLRDTKRYWEKEVGRRRGSTGKRTKKRETIFTLHRLSEAGG